MNKLRWFLLLVVLLLLGGGVWFWNLGAPAAVPAPTTITLHDLTGQVEVMGTNGVWNRANEGQVALAGQTVRTGVESGVSVDFYQQGETRLAANSTLVIGSDTAHNEETDALAVHLRLEQGRVWSRVRSLLDLESDYTITTDQVVATVRGTTFDLAKLEDGTSSLRVMHSVVKGNSGLVSEGYEQVFSATPSKMPASGRISEKELLTSWMQTNQTADTQAMKRWRERDLLAMNHGRTGSPTKLAQLSVGLRGALAKKDLYKTLQEVAEQELVRLHALALQGKNDEALDALKSARTRLAKVDLSSAEARIFLRKLAPRAQRLFEDIEEDHPGYVVKQELETLLLSNNTDTTRKALYDVLRLNQRLDTLMKGQRTPAKERILNDIRTKTEATLKEPLPANASKAALMLQERWEALRVRIEMLSVQPLQPLRVLPLDTPILKPILKPLPVLAPLPLPEKEPVLDKPLLVPLEPIKQ